jgi:predicted amidohydrolase YtcJ
MKPTRTLLAALSGVTLLFTGCDSNPPSATAQTADTIYHNGSILTMAGKEASYVEALAVKDGKIIFAGAKDDALKQKGDATKVVDLGGKHLMPSFIDGHSHFINAMSLANQANCYAAPFGSGDTKEGIIASLAFPSQPVMVQHVSLHGAVLNSAALKKYNVTSDTKTPPGGVILRKPGSEDPEGLVMESAWLPIFAALPKPSPEEELEALVEGQKIFAAAGVTTAHEGATHLDQLQTLQRGAKAGKLSIDVIAFPFITEMQMTLRTNPPSSFGKYDQRLKLGGIKITLDGSPQGRTAHFTTPYLTDGPGGQKEWRGEPMFPEPEIPKMVKAVYDAGLPLIIHCNGDAALDNFLKAHEAALGDRKAGDHRTGIIHCQFVRKDQLDQIAAWKIIPSFYTEHTYFFGSTHVKQRGKEQAHFLSPMKSALDRGILCANHTDFNVAPIDQLFVVWSAVNRVSREGEVIGPDERISAYEALKAVTVNCAYWYREEATKGTLEAGKLADLVILDKDPVKVEPMAIKDIKVLETIKEGRTIYTASAGS